MKFRPVEERFWEKVDVKSDDECWNWTAHLHVGYGELKIGRTNILAHRISYCLHFGVVISSDVCVLHKCDNRKCVNPNHLYLGDRLDNALDRKNRNRGGDLKGVNNGRSKLCDLEVLEIRRLYSTGKIYQKTLGNLFCCSQKTISHIISYDNWAHI